MTTTAKVFEGVSLVLLHDEGSRRRVVNTAVQLEISTRQYEAVIKIFNGKHIVRTIAINKDLEMAKVGKLGLVITSDNETYLAKFTQPEDVQNFEFTLKEAKNKKEDSVFSKRTDSASAEQYFQFYSYLSQQQNMMQDYVRTSTYQRAMIENPTDFIDKVVLDVGAGSGILSFFAVQAGAKKVYAIEASSMAQHCEELVHSNMLSEQVVVLTGKIEEIELPEMVDVIVSEPMGYMLFNERMLETYLHAKKWLKPGGKMFPSLGDLHIVPFTDDALYMEMFSKANFWHQPSFHGVDLTSLRDAALSEYFHQPVVDTFDIRICLSQPEKYTVDFRTALETDLQDIDIPVSFVVQQSGSVHGLAFWFEVAFNGSQSTVWLSTSPTQPLTHWYQVRCLLPNPIFAKQGQTLVGRVHLTSNARQSYDIDVELGVAGTDVKSTNTLDLKNPCFRYTGQQVQAPPGYNRLSPTEAYWNQQDCTATLDQMSTESYGIALLNGGINDGSQYVQVAPSGVLFNNYMPVVGDISPGSNVVAPALAMTLNAAAAAASNQNHSSVVPAVLPGGFVLEHSASVVSTAQFPLSSNLMIGDYMVPSNIILPSAQQGVNILHYKVVGDT